MPSSLSNLFIERPLLDEPQHLFCTQTEVLLGDGEYHADHLRSHCLLGVVLPNLQLLYDVFIRLRVIQKEVLWVWYACLTHVDTDVVESENMWRLEYFATAFEEENLFP